MSRLRGTIGLLACGVSSLVLDGAAQAQVAASDPPSAAAASAAVSDQAQPATSNRPSDTPTAAAASSGGDTGAGNTQGGLQEIVVTAQHRVENIQKTPLSITALSGDDLIKQGGQDASSLQRLVPNVQVNQSGGTASIAIRGIVSTNNTEVGDPALAFNLDGVYLGRPQQAGGLFYDVDRIEVLRGPQGTLYGRNATSGAVNIITKKPTNQLSAEGTFEIGSYDLYHAQGALNVPVADWLKVRVAMSGYSQGSFYKTPPWESYGKTNDVAGRIHVLMEPTSDLSILLTGDYSKLTGTPSTGPLLPLGDHPRTIYNLTIPGTIDQKDFGGTATVNWNVGLGTITYIGAYREQQQYTLAGLNTAPLAVKATANPRQVSNELRFTHDGENIKLVAGLFAYSEKNEWLVYLPPAVAFLMPHVDSKSKAAFGQVTFTPVDGLHLTGGLRYTSDHKSRTGGNWAYDPNFPCTYLQCIADPHLILLYPDIADYKWHKLNYRAGVDFDLSTRNLLYASVATGYKAGGYFDGVPPNNFYDPENVRSIEVGSKNRFLDNTLQVNVSAFHYRYTDFQVSFADQATRVTHTLNAQLAVNYGAELETNYQLTHNDYLSFAFAYLHASYKKFFLPAPDQFGRQDYKGNRLQQAPRINVNLGYTHTFDLANDGHLSASGYMHYQSSSELAYQNLPVTHQGSYSRSDFNLTYAAPSKAWDLTLYVRNIENKLVLTGASANDAPNQATGSGTLSMPRTFGAIMTVKM